jgi:magnesium chelatase subunit D
MKMRSGVAWPLNLLLAGHRSPGSLACSPANLPTPIACRLVLIPDLAQLGLLGQRACVSLLDNPDARLERHGQARRWRPRICWLAACRASELPQVAAHLLDRFALRVEGGVLRTPDRVQVLRTQVAAEQATPPPLVMPPAVLAQIGAAMQRPLAHPTPDVVTRVLELFPDAATAESSRRALSFARLIMALSRLDDTTPAALLRKANWGQTQRDEPPEQTQPTNGAAGTPPKPDQVGTNAGAPGGTEPTTQPVGTTTTDASDSYEPVPPGVTPGPETLAGGMEATLPGLNMRLYPEDGPRQQASEPLRLPLRRFRASAAASGPIIGGEQTTTTEDLALVATLIEAAKWQRLRQGRGEARPRRLRCSAEAAPVFISASDRRHVSPSLPSCGRLSVPGSFPQHCLCAPHLELHATLCLAPGQSYRRMRWLPHHV